MEGLKTALENPEIQEAHELYQRFTNDEPLRNEYLARQMYRMDQESRMTSAREEGQLQAKRETAGNLKLLGMDVEKIAQATGLSAEEVRGL